MAIVGVRPRYIKEMKFFRLTYFAATAAFATLAVPSVKAQTGRSAYDFLTIPTSSHVYALGGANISLIDPDVTLVEQNPALLGPEIERQLAVSYMHYMGSANFAGARFGHAAGERGAWAIGMRYLNYGEITGYDHTGVATGSFTPTDIAAEGSYSHDFTDRLRGGINLKMIYSNYEQYSAFAMAVDLGINYYDDDHDLSLSAVLKNMGGQLKRFEDAYDRLPFDVQLGLTKGLGTSFSFSVTARHLTRWNLPYYQHDDDGTKEVEMKSSFGKNLFRHLVFGLQYEPSDKFYVALGYDYKTRSDMSTYQRNFFSGVSVGLGIRAGSFNVGAAYAMPHKSASTLMINLALDI